MDFPAECFEYCGKCNRSRALHVYDYCLYSPFKFEPAPSLHSILEANSVKDMQEAEHLAYLNYVIQTVNDQ